MTFSEWFFNHVPHIDRDGYSNVLELGHAYPGYSFIRRQRRSRFYQATGNQIFGSSWESVIRGQRRRHDDPVLQERVRLPRRCWRRMKRTLERKYEDPRSPLYEYEQLEAGCIRLLRLLPGEEDAELDVMLTASPLTAAVPFETLSYVWGEPGLCYIRCSQRWLKVTDNLFQALHKLRSRTEERVFWIDAICIDQSDLNERAIQVQMMRNIYAGSWKTTVWLGSVPELQANTAKMLTHLIQFKQNTEASISNAFDRSVWWQLGALWRDPWFSRTWIVQEVAVSQDITVLTKSGAWSWDDFVLAAITASDNFKGFQSVFDPDNLVRLSSIRHLYIQKQISGTLQALNFTRRSASTLDSDKIYGVLGLADSQFHVDYKETASETFIRFAVDCMLHGPEYERLMLLNLVNDHIYSLKPDLPSWIPDWEVRQGPKPFLTWPIFTMWRASSDSIPRTSLSNGNHNLHIRGFVLDQIEYIGILYREAIPVSGAAKRKPKSSARGFRWFLRAGHSMAQATRRSQQWYDIAMSDGFMYGDTTARYKAYLLTLVASSGDQATDDESMSKLEQGFRTWHNMSTKAMTNDFEFITESVGKIETVARSDTMDFITQNVNFAWGRRFFASQSIGMIGLCPYLVGRGDLVVILHGARTPYIIREVRNGKYRFLGECYAHGFMYGEAMEREQAGNVQDFEFI